MPRNTKRGRRFGFALLLLGLFAVFGASSPALAEQPADPGGNAPGQTGEKPAGNNGVIKVDGVPLDDAVGPDAEQSPGRSHRDNEPHVSSCGFNVDWYGFEAGDGESVVTFELWGPNKGHQLLVDNGSVDAGGDAQGNADDQDGTKSYSLDSALATADAIEGVDPNEQQGWLVKVTAETDGLSQGAHKKSKVFWISDDECGGGSPQGNNPTLLVLGQVITTTTTTTVAPTTTAAPVVAAVEETTTVPVAVLGVQLARTGAPARTLLMLAGLALVVGGALLMAGKERAEAR